MKEPPRHVLSEVEGTPRPPRGNLTTDKHGWTQRRGQKARVKSRSAKAKTADPAVIARSPHGHVIASEAKQSSGGLGAGSATWQSSGQEGRHGLRPLGDRSEPLLARRPIVLAVKFFLPLALLAVGFSFGAELQFTAQADRTTVGLGERFILTVTVVGSGIGRVPRPKLPALHDFSRLGSTSSQSSNISFVNGRVTREQAVSFIYYLAPEKLGELVIGPCSLDFRGSIYQTRPITITVTKESQQPAQRQRRMPDPFSPFPVQPQPSGSVKEDIHLIAGANRTDVYQGEQVTVSYTFYTKLRIADLKLAQVPAFSGFWVEKLYDAEELEYHPREYDKQQYNAALIKKVALFPTRSGQLRVGAMKLAGATVRRGGFFFNTTEPFEVASSPITITVKALPDSGRPPSFCGGVGKFDLFASLDKDSSEAGEPLNLTVKVSGTGNIQLVGEPKIPRIMGVKTLSPETRDKITKASGKVTGTREFAYPMIPQADGKYLVPAIEMGFFDPGHECYYTLATSRLEFFASGARRTGQVVGTEAGVRVLGSDIMHIKSGIRGLNDVRALGLWQVLPPWWGWLFYPAGVVILVFGVVLGRHRRKLEQDRGYARRIRSSRLVKKRLAEAAKLLEQSQEGEFYAALSRAVLGYVGDRFNLEALGMTGDELGRELEQRGVLAGTVAGLRQLIQSCDAARFSPGMAECSARQTFEQAIKVLEAL